MEEFLTVRELCEQLRVSRYEVSKWMKLKDHIPFYRITKTSELRFRKSEVEEWLERQRKEGNNESETQ